MARALALLAGLLLAFEPIQSQSQRGAGPDRLVTIRDLSVEHPCAMLILLHIFYFGPVGADREAGESFIYVDHPPSSEVIADVVDGLNSDDLGPLALALQWNA